jgi:hypothetical protein
VEFDVELRSYKFTVDLLVRGQKLDSKVVKFDLKREAELKKFESLRTYFETWVIVCFECNKLKGKFRLQMNDKIFADLWCLKVDLDD